MCKGLNGEQITVHGKYNVAISASAMINMTEWYIRRCMELESQLHQCREREKKMLAVVDAAREYREAQERLADAVGEERPTLIGLCHGKIHACRKDLDEALAALDSEGVE